MVSINQHTNKSAYHIVLIRRLQSIIYFILSLINQSPLNPIMPSGLGKEGKGLWDKATSGVVKELVRERDKTFVRTNGNITKKDDIVDDLVRASAASFGFFSEISHHRRDKKSFDSGKDSQSELQKDDEDRKQRAHEAIWDLDDLEQDAAKQKIPKQQTSSNANKESKDPATAFINRHPVESGIDGSPNVKIALPVVLPQRRPKTRVRGFVRAYAPVLGGAGIDQETFLDFVDTLNQSLVPNPWLNAINLAGFADIAYPDPILTAFGIMLGFAVEGVMEAQSRFRSNTFLDRINADFFAPRGLICLVATWRPDTSDKNVSVNLEGDTDKSASEADLPKDMRQDLSNNNTDEQGIQKIRGQMEEKLRPHKGGFLWSEPAPLIFPTLEEMPAASKSDGEKKVKGMDRAEAWLDGFIDKRAMVQWVDENPSLPAANALPRPQFKSRYADPTHPASSGDIAALVTGGRWQFKKKEKSTKESPSDTSSPNSDDNKKEVEKEKNEEVSKKIEDLNSSSNIGHEKSKGKLDHKESEQDDVKNERGVKENEDEDEKEREKKDKKERKKKEKEERKKREKEEEEQKKKAKEEKKEKEKDEKKKKLELEKEKKSKKDEKPDDMIKSLFQKDVLYLIILNLPSEEQMAELNRSGRSDP
ncbi:FAD binding domain protein [Colletotrichum truncatum]|uniref:FAD binding domain protein n=1 Tax=Colletotrichum truncatum TaxID=5467 RepID=A0ACC3YPL9_COLTU|nr:FAD binding domain protein [Colletotrichum truncatum]KAF6796866.1 FAD binding domain protein [Colletotrichum truncatum]